MNRTSKKSLIIYLYKEIRMIISVILFFKVLQLLFQRTEFNKFLIYVILISLLIDAINITQEFFFLKWKFIDKSLIINKGIILKKNVRIDNDKIRGIQKEASWLFRILRLSKVKIYITSTGDDANIVFNYLTRKQISELNKWYTPTTNLKIDNNTNNKTISVSTTKLIISSIFSTNYLYIITILSFIDEITSHFHISIINFVISNYKNLSVIILMIIGGIISSFIKQFINYYYLKIKVFSDSLEIRNGFFSNGSVMIDKKNIIGFKYTQNIGQTIFDLWSVSVIVDNYKIKNDGAKLAAILPFATTSDILEFEEQFYGKHTFVDKNIIKRNNKIYFNFLFFVVITGVSVMNVNFSLIFIIFLGYHTLIKKNITYKNSLLLIDKTIFKREIVMVKESKIQWKQSIKIFGKIEYKKISYIFNPVKIVRYFKLK